MFKGLKNLYQKTKYKIRNRILTNKYKGDIPRDLHNATLKIKKRLFTKPKIFTEGEIEFIDLSESAIQVHAFIREHNLSKRATRALWDKFELIKDDSVLASYK